MHSNLISAVEARDSSWPNLSAALGAYIYAIGGRSAGNAGPTERYDPATNNWTRLADMGFKFLRGAVAVLGGEIWACGGQDPINKPAPWGACKILDTLENSWIAAPTMNEARSVVMNSKLRSLRHHIGST